MWSGTPSAWTVDVGSIPAVSSLMDTLLKINHWIDDTIWIYHVGTHFATFKKDITGQWSLTWFNKCYGGYIQAACYMLDDYLESNK